MVALATTGLDVSNLCLSCKTLKAILGYILMVDVTLGLMSKVPWRFTPQSESKLQPLVWGR